MDAKEMQNKLSSTALRSCSEMQFSNQRKNNSSIDLDKFAILSPEMLCAIGLDGYFRFVSPMWTRVLGFSRSEMTHRPWLEWVHPEDYETTLEKMHSLAIGSSEIVTFVHRYRCKNDSYTWLSWKLTLAREEKVIYATVRDLGSSPWCSIPASEPSKLQSDAIANPFNTTESHFRLMVEAVEDYAIYMLDENGCVISWNSGAQRIKGYTAEEIVGCSASCFFPEKDVREGRPASVLLAAATEGRYQEENWRICKDGSQFWASVTIAAIRDEAGRLLGFSVVTRDITERKNTQEALQAAYENLEKRVLERTAALTETNDRLVREVTMRQRTEEALRESEQRLQKQAQELKHALHQLKTTQSQLLQAEKMSSLGQLVAGVAHEINNPISFIYGNIDHLSHYVEELMDALELYRQHYPEPVPEIENVLQEMDLNFIVSDMPKLLESMQSGADRIREIVLNLRDFSREDRDRLKETDIHERIERSLLVLQNRFKGDADRAEIQVVKEYNALPKVECYAGQFDRVFVNLLCNACDALEKRRELRDPSTEPPTVCIRTYQKGDRIAIRIRDNGAGIHSKVGSRIFDPFFTTKPVGQGTGLGLFVSYQIVVERHGGALRCLSAPDRGAEFFIEIPLRQPQPSLQQSQPQELVQQDGLEAIA